MTQQHASFGLEPFQYCTKTIMFSYAIEVSLGTMASLWKKSSKNVYGYILLSKTSGLNWMAKFLWT